MNERQALRLTNAALTILGHDPLETLPASEMLVGPLQAALVALGYEAYVSPRAVTFKAGPYGRKPAELARRVAIAWGVMADPANGEVRLPEALTEFNAAFDRGEYPHLVESSPEPATPEEVADQIY